ncbi:MAG: flavin reductase family protein [Tetragenococcus halophilus]|nr:flavin reductase family protein [Tetragenococcus halophilus]
MVDFKADELTTLEQYKIIIGSVVPRPIAWVTTLSKDREVVNAAPYSFFNGASNELPLLTVASLRVEGEMKHTAKNILYHKEAVVQMVDQSVAEDMNATCTSLASDKSELALTGVSLLDSQMITVPRIKETKIQFEWVLHQHLPITDENGKIITDFFILRVLVNHLDEAVFDRKTGYIQSQSLDPVARLAGNQYTTLGKEFTMIRPD